MPINFAYAYASGGAVVSGVAYKLTQKIKLSLKEWFAFIMSLASFGAISFAILGPYMSATASTESRIGFAVLLAIGMTETIAFVIIALQRIIELIPEELRQFISKKWGNGK
jgi:hypothetical protein